MNTLKLNPTASTLRTRVINEVATQKAVADIMLNGRVGEYGLKRSTRFVAAGNHTKHAAGAEPVD